jgi:hypothetical protein
MDRPVVRAGLAVVLLVVLAGVFLAIRAGRDGGDDPQLIAPPTGQAAGTPVPDEDTGPIEGSGPVVASLRRTSPCATRTARS